MTTTHVKHRSDFLLTKDVLYLTILLTKDIPFYSQKTFLWIENLICIPYLTLTDVSNVYCILYEMAVL